MKKLFWMISLLLVFSLVGGLSAQIPSKGFFIGGSATALMMNGKGEIEDEDFDVADDLLEVDVTESTYNFTVEWSSPGLGWGNRFLYGIKPVVGYRFSPQLAVIGSYSVYMTKKTDQSETVNGHGHFDDLQVDIEMESEYTQRVTQILAQYHITPGKEFFLIGGMEFASMKTDIGFTLRDTWSSGSESDDVDGEDKASGLVVGLGLEKPLQSKKNVALVATAMYSFTKYDGDELVEDVDMKIGVGGFIANVGLRMYFDSGASAQ